MVPKIPSCNYMLIMQPSRLKFISNQFHDSELLARSQYSEGPATGHLDTGFSWFPCAQKQMLRWFPRFQVATTCFSCSHSDLNLLVTNFMMSDCWLEVSIRKVLRPATSAQIFSWFRWSLKANAEMVPNIPSCHYMRLMQPSLLKFSSKQFHILYTCKITTATG